MKNIVLFLFLALTADEALTAARQIWGATAYARKNGQNYQLGCGENKTMISSSKKSWEDAFQAVDLKKNGPRTISVEARDSAGNIGTHSVMIFLCNKS